MACTDCGKRLNIGMIQKIDSNTGKRYKSCPHCSDADGEEHIFHPYPSAFGKTPARITARNPDGYQSYCTDCRRLPKGTLSRSYKNGRKCSELK